MRHAQPLFSIHLFSSRSSEAPGQSVASRLVSTEGGTLKFQMEISRPDIPFSCLSCRRAPFTRQPSAEGRGGGQPPGGVLIESLLPI